MDRLEAVFVHLTDLHFGRQPDCHGSRDSVPTAARIHFLERSLSRFVFHHCTPHSSLAARNLKPSLIRILGQLERDEGYERDRVIGFDGFFVTGDLVTISSPKARSNVRRFLWGGSFFDYKSPNLGLARGRKRVFVNGGNHDKLHAYKETIEWAREDFKPHVPIRREAVVRPLVIRGRSYVVASLDTNCYLGPAFPVGLASRKVVASGDVDERAVAMLEDELNRLKYAKDDELPGGFDFEASLRVLLLHHAPRVSPFGIRQLALDLLVPHRCRNLKRALPVAQDFELLVVHGHMHTSTGYHWNRVPVISSGTALQMRGDHQGANDYSLLKVYESGAVLRVPVKWSGARGFQPQEDEEIQTRIGASAAPNSRPESARARRSARLRCNW